LERKYKIQGVSGKQERNGNNGQENQRGDSQQSIDRDGQKVTKMELPKINKSARLAMNSIVALSHYSPLAANNNTVCALIIKDQLNQKEEVNKLLILEKDKFKKNTQLSDEEREYPNEYNRIFRDDLEIEDIVRQKDRNVKKLKIKEISQKGDNSEKKR
jgi:hypothetical protein